LLVEEARLESWWLPTARGSFYTSGHFIHCAASNRLERLLLRGWANWASRLLLYTKFHLGVWLQKCHANGSILTSLHVQGCKF